MAQTNFSKEIQAFTDQVQLFEDAMYDVYSTRNIDDSIGTIDPTTWEPGSMPALDGLGELVGVLRSSGMSDAQLRNLIRAYIQINGSGGEPDRLVDVVQLFVGAPICHYYDLPCTMWIQFDAPAPSGLWSIIKRMVCAGVQLQLVEMYDPYIFASNFPFLFDSATQGFDNGYLSYAITAAYVF